MNDVVGKLFSALIGGLIIWLVSRFYNRSRLYCAPSSLYEYSTLVDAGSGSTVQLVIANRGRKTEESVEVQLSNEYAYSVIATTQNGLDISQEKIIQIPALLPNSEISVVFVAEGRPRFSKDSIRGIRSKHNKGTIGDSITSAEQLSPATAAFVYVMLLIIAIFGYGIGRIFGEPLWFWGKQKFLASHAQEFKEGCATALSNAAKEKAKGALDEKSLKIFALSAINVKKVSTVGDSIFVDVEVNNLIDSPVEYSLRLLTDTTDSTSERSLIDNDHIYDILLTSKNGKRSYSMSRFFPEDHTPKKFWIETRVDLGDYWITLKRTFFFGTDAASSCSIYDT